MAHKSEPQMLESFAVLVYAPFQRLLGTLRRFPYLETRNLSLDWMDVCIQNANFVCSWVVMSQNEKIVHLEQQTKRCLYSL